MSPFIKKLNFKNNTHVYSKQSALNKGDNSNTVQVFQSFLKLSSI